MAHNEITQRADASIRSEGATVRDLLVGLSGIAPEQALLDCAEILPYPNTRLAQQPLGGKAKRVFDVVAASAILALASPLLLSVALAVKVSDSGPVLFGHKRTGFRGQDFQCLKFRTMVANADVRLEEYLASNAAAAREWSESRKLRKDPRVTALGNFLRKTSLDELPQLLNVIRGDMSLVGPRPVPVAELGLYGVRKFSYLAARPGITGLWQVSGRSATTYDRRTELDEQYVLQWSFWGDVKIILRTVPELLPSPRAY